MIRRVLAIAGGIALAASLAACAPDTASETGTGGADASADLPTGTIGAAHFDEFALVAGDGDIRVAAYVDPSCPHCADFEAEVGDTIAELVEDGTITYAVHPMNFLDRASDTAYSSRAGSAMTCVATEAPEALLPMVAAVFANQPSDAAGLDDPALSQLAADAGAPGAADCIAANTYVDWVQASNDQALTGPIEGAEIERVEGTPTLLVDGAPYTGAFDADEVRAFITGN
ncbi:DsbA family protein [Agromyces sp. SYSU T00194]|uniref:DsbA family protein n=1 Tax=Agromyces chitinivorans TaxID=3158560 RepID=UPI0033914782